MNATIAFNGLVSKNDAINLMQNADLTEKSRTLYSIKIYYHIQKVGTEILTFGDNGIEKKKNITVIRLLFFKKM